MERAILIVCMAFCALCLRLLLRHDWLRWTLPMCEAEAEVIGHDSKFDEGHHAFAARLRFTGEGQVHVVTDALYGPTRSLPVGTRIRVKWPTGHPTLARVPRPWMWTGVYGVLLYLAGVLVGKWIGWIG